MLSVAERFWAKVNKDSGHRAPAMESDCWLWTASTSGSGYGKFMLTKAGGRTVLGEAHRVAWMLTGGTIGDGLYVCHRCDVKVCVRPDHLFIGTATDNMQDARKKGKHKNAEKTHCKRGHPFTDANIYRTATGGRSCRICLRAHIRASEAKKRRADPAAARKRAHEKWLTFKAGHPNYDKGRKRGPHHPVTA
jgi:hypothetical protein